MTGPLRDGPLTFSEELLVLLLNDEWGTLASIPRTRLDCALAGAVLMDLAFANRIDTDLETLFVIDRTPTGNPLLDPVLAKIAARNEWSGTLAWLKSLGAEDAVRVRDQALVLLAQLRRLDLIGRELARAVSDIDRGVARTLAAAVGMYGAGRLRRR